ncbi:hypothetical protein KLP28_08170 [Nocardioidaceae bacterium]|nr:hypothetical protein KLP28_08170 [Nocardioidaceae bacterium]
MSTQDDEERLAKDDGHRYEAPESREEEEAKGIDFLVLGAVVLIIMVLGATGAIPLYSY